MILRLSVIGLSSAAAIFACAANAAAGPIETVFSNIPGHPTAAVPGAMDIAFKHGEGIRLTAPAASADGRRWAVRAAVSDGEARPGEVILVGDAAGAVVAVRTGQPAPSGHGVFVALAPEVTVADDGVFTFEAAVELDGVTTVRAYRGRVGASGRAALAAAAPVAAEAGVLPAEVADPGEGAAAFSVESLVVTPGGDWLARGVDESGRQWVFRNGEPVAMSGAPVTLDPAETHRFGGEGGPSAFFSMHANAAGDVVVGGVAESEVGERGAAVVLNNQRVILRDGDRVDLGGSDAADDAYISGFSADGAFLTDGGWYYFNAELRTAEGRPLGQALLRTRVCKPDWDASGGANSADIAAFLTAWVVSITEGCALADYNRDGHANSADISQFLSDWLNAVGGGC